MRSTVRVSIRTAFVLFLLASYQAFGFISSVTNFVTDPSDFYDDGYNQNIAVQFRWTITATNATAQNLEYSPDNVSWSNWVTLTSDAIAFDNARVKWTSNSWWRVKTYNLSESATSIVLHVVGNMPPSHLGGSTADSTHMNVTWESAGGILDGYTVQQATDSLFTVGLTNTFVAGIDSSAVTLNFAYVLNTFYYFRVLSHSVGGNSEAMNKPIAYLVVAPNGPPTTPTIVIPPTSQSVATSIQMIFNNTALNATGFQVQRSLDNSTWSTIPYIADGLVVNDTGLTPGTTNFYRIAATNSIGSSGYVSDSIRIANTPGVGASTSWYVSTNAFAGNNTGTNWANAWVAFRSVNWSAMGPGHTLNLDGGTNGMEYHDYLTSWVDGAYGNPLLVRASREASHNGHILQHGGVGTRSSWVKFDGSKADEVLSSIGGDTNNINWTVKQTGEEDGTFNACIDTPTAIGAEFWSLGCTGTGNNLSSDSITAVHLGPSTGIGCSNVVLAGCWVYDNKSSGVVEEMGVTYGLKGNPPGVFIHHNTIERFHNNGMVLTRSEYIYANIIRNTAFPAVAHPDGLQGGIQDVTIANNIIGNTEGATFYPNLSDSLYSNLKVVNNFWYNDLTNNVDESLSLQFSMLPDGVVVKDITISNMVWSGNTFYGIQSSSLSIGNSSFTNHLRACRFENNLWFSGAKCRTDASQFSTGKAEYQQTDVIFDYNIVCGPSKFISYRTVDSPFDPLNVNTFSTAEAFNSLTIYTHNSSSSPAVVSVTNRNLALLGTDTVAKGNGVDLSSLASTVTNITTSLGVGRGPAWDVGAYQFDRSLMAWLFPPSLDTSWTNTYIAIDYSGNNNYAQSVTNQAITYVGNYIPQVVAGPMPNTYGANFRIHGAAEYVAVYSNTPAWNNGYAGYPLGDWMAVTNMAGIAKLTNATVACWVNFTSAPNSAAYIISAGWNSTDSDPDTNSWELSRFNIGNETMGLFQFRGASTSGRQTLVWPVGEPTNQWVHYAVTWNAASNSIIGYTNGVPFETNTLQANYLNVDNNHNSPDSLMLGAGTHGGTWKIDAAAGDPYPNHGWLLGQLADIRIYNRDLSPSEVSALVNGLGSSSGGSSGGGNGGNGNGGNGGSTNRTGRVIHLHVHKP